jgi:hypothetical protein
MAKEFECHPTSEHQEKKFRHPWVESTQVLSISSQRFFLRSVLHQRSVQVTYSTTILLLFDYRYIFLDNVSSVRLSP